MSYINIKNEDAVFKRRAIQGDFLTMVEETKLNPYNYNAYVEYEEPVIDHITDSVAKFKVSKFTDSQNQILLETYLRFKHRYARAKGHEINYSSRPPFWKCYKYLSERMLPFDIARWHGRLSIPFSLSFEKDLEDHEAFGQQVNTYFSKMDLNKFYAKKVSALTTIIEEQNQLAENKRQYWYKIHFLINETKCKKTNKLFESLDLTQEVARDEINFETPQEIEMVAKIFVRYLYLKYKTSPELSDEDRLLETETKVDADVLRDFIQKKSGIYKRRVNDDTKEIEVANLEIQMFDLVGGDDLYYDQTTRLIVESMSRPNDRDEELEMEDVIFSHNKDEWEKQNLKRRGQTKKDRPVEQKKNQTKKVAQLLTKEQRQNQERDERMRRRQDREEKENQKVEVIEDEEDADDGQLEATPPNRLLDIMFEDTHLTSQNKDRLQNFNYILS